METIDQLLYRLSKLDIKIWAEEERLRCNAPKGMLTQDLRAELSARKSEILAFLGSNRLLAPGEHAEVQGQPRIEPVERRGPPPLSFAQQRLWFLDQLEEANRAYTLVGAIQLRGGLNVPLLERCFAQIVQRHEVLRTTFPVVDGQPVQSIAESLEIAIEVVDLRAVPEVDKRKRVDSIVAAQAKRPFDLMQGPLLRLQLLHVGPSPAGAHLFSSNTGDAEHVLIVTLHHIIADGWSFGLLIQEISELYAAALAGERASLAALPIQYADFAHWQRERVQSGALAGQLAYWQRQLKGAPAQLELPTDHARPPVQRFEGLAARFEIEGELLDSLTSIGKRAGASLFMTLYAAFAAFLARYSGQDDLVVGTPIANRNRPEIAFGA